MKFPSIKLQVPNERFLPFSSFFFCFWAAHSEFFRLQVKRFSEIHFTAKFWSFSLKTRFRMAGGEKKPAAIFLPKKWRTKPQCFTSLCRQAQLHIFTRRQPLFTESPLRLACEVAPFHSACEEVSLRCPWSFLPSSFAEASEDKSGVRLVFFFLLRSAYTAALPPWILFLQCYIIYGRRISLCQKANCVHCLLTLRYKFWMPIKPINTAKGEEKWKNFYCLHYWQQHWMF